MTAVPSFNESLFEVLCSYLAAGLPIFPVWGLKQDGTCQCPLGKECPPKQRGKHPHGKFAPSGFKNATREKHIVREWLKRAPTCNWAVRTGELEATGRYLVVLDVDPRNGGDESYAALEEVHGPLPDGPQQDTGGNGLHLFFATDKPMEAGSLGPGLDFLAKDRYCILDPSKHHSGGEYTWVVGKSLQDLKIPDAPEWMLEGVESKSSAPRPRRTGVDTARETVLGEAFALAGKLGVEYPDGTIAVECPQAHLHSDNRGRGQDSSTVILPPAGGSRFGGFRCLHLNHCSQLKWHDVLNSLPPAVVDEAKRKYPLRPVAVNEAAVVAEPANDDPTAKREPAKKDRMQLLREKLHYKQTKSGAAVIENDLVNVRTVLEYDPRWDGVLAFDEFTQQLMFVGEPPWHADDRGGGSQSETWTDNDSLRLHLWFKRYHGIDQSEEKLARAAYLAGHRKPINSLQDWVRSLEWDGVPRVDTWLTRYLGTKANDYTTAVGRYWLISAIARAMTPGCKADYVLLLEGPQGIGKSEALRILAGDKWFADSPVDIGNKDAFVFMQGKWIIELAELASLMKVENERAKQFFTSPVDNYRPPYGKTNVKVPRSCVFAGTVNPESHGYLTDSTGNRRYWPVECLTIDREALAADREQLWAEARVLFAAGERWWPQGADEHAAFSKQQVERETSDPWATLLWIYLNSEEGSKVHRLRTTDLMHVLDLDASRMGRSEETRIGRCLKKIGWRHERVREDGYRFWAYVRGPQGAP